MPRMYIHPSAPVLLLLLFIDFSRCDKAIKEFPHYHLLSLQYTAYLQKRKKPPQEHTFAKPALADACDILLTKQSYHIVCDCAHTKAIGRKSRVRHSYS